MATSTQASSSATSPSSNSACLDPLDIDRYLNFDQAIYPSPSISPVSFRSKSIAPPTPFLINPNNSPTSFASNPNNTLLPSQPSDHQTFAGPSHQYELHKQQAGLPVGALANTLAVNEATNLQYGRMPQNFAFAPMDYFGMNSTNDFFDFGNSSSQDSSLGTVSEMDIDFDSPTPNYFLPVDTLMTADYVDPNVIGGQEETSISPPVQTTGRLWPGVHQQQAAVAKAQAQAQQQKQKEQQRNTQQPQSNAHPQPRQSASRANGTAARPPTDPIVEERISRLLNQMRHSSMASSNDDDVTTPTGNGSLSNSARSRKEEEEMDEDERLLASEEGKKLSSKERRQLRNKVSARAFRSRRKEYIGQLEGEVATKQSEADDLRIENEALRSENTRLTDLTRMLLSSTAFSTFLNDLSGTTPSVLASTPSQSSASTAQQPQASPRKDVNPHRVASQQLQAPQQDSTHVGMTLIPDRTVDFSAFNPTNSTWANNMDYGFNNAQVFAVTSLPQGPAVDQIDTAMLSGKASNVVGQYPPNEEAKNETPVVERMPLIKKNAVEPSKDIHTCDNDVKLDQSDPAFALFVNYPAASQSNPSAAGTPDDKLLFGGIELEKVFGRYELILDDDSHDGQVSPAALERFERMCASVEAAVERISAVTAHL